MNPELTEAESGVGSCSNFPDCTSYTSCNLNLSSIKEGDERRGDRDPLVLLITEAPDEESSEGTAYSGSTSDRILSMFYDEEYGISIGGSQPESFPEFLLENRFYATSAIKCHVSDCSISTIDSRVISSCRETFLAEQIAAMDNLELIISMGKVATASILKKDPSSVTLTEMIGREKRGIMTSDLGFDPEIVVFPHPSGASPLSNPPLIHQEGNRSQWTKKMQFREALTYVRETLDDLGFNVAQESPSCWDSPPGLSDFS